jgi:hypothetical protein
MSRCWRRNVTDVASKYFYGAAGDGGCTKYFYGARARPRVRQLVHRVCRTIADWGLADGVFATPEDAETFYDELSWLCLNQYGSFNSPVWFNCGLFHQYGVGKESARGQLLHRPRERRGPSRDLAVRKPAVLRLLHPVGAGHDGRHHGAGAQRGDAVQVRQRHGHGPLAHPQRAREA